MKASRQKDPKVIKLPAKGKGGKTNTGEQKVPKETKVPVKRGASKTTTDEQKDPKVIKLPTKHRANKSTTGEQKSQHIHKEIGSVDAFLVKKDENLSPCNAAEGMDSALRDGAQFPEMTKGLPVLGNDGEKTLLPHSKIRLQLFPVNEGMRIGLARDGFHPYLELTLRPQKKISSVLKHLISKWGSSSAALGEPVLLPYRMQGSGSSNRRWTLSDGDTSAGDVYAAVGSPAVFRLRYGWFSTEPKTSGELSTSANDNADLQSEGIQRDSSRQIEKENGVGKHSMLPRNSLEPMNEAENMDDEKITNVDILSDDQRQVDGNHSQSLELMLDNAININIGCLLSEASLQSNCNNGDKKQIEKDGSLHPVNVRSDSKSFAVWADCPSISIGGLLSEASLQGKFSHLGEKSTVSNPSLQRTLLNSDGCQGSKPSTYDSCLSILDAEETCHAFPSKKFTSSGKDVTGFGGGSSQSSSSKLFKFLSAAKANNRAGLPQDCYSRI